MFRKIDAIISTMNKCFDVIPETRIAFIFEENSQILRFFFR